MGVAPGLAACIGYMYGNLSATENFNININMKVSIPFGHDWPYNNNLVPNFPYVMVKHFYPELSDSVAIPSTFSQQIQSFNAGAYCDGGSCETSAHISNTGYYYVPSGCASQTCKLMFHLHGCGGSAVEMGNDPTVHIRNSGLLQNADAHNIIMVFPQSMPGCWNHDGNYNIEPSCKHITDNYSCKAYLTHENVQVTALEKMVRDIIRVS